MSKGGFLEVEPILKKGKHDDTGDGGPLMPKTPCRMLFVGASGSGKSQLVANIIMKGWIPFSRIVLCAKNPDQDVYEQLQEFIEEAVEDSDMKKGKDEFFKIVTEVNEVPKVEDFDRHTKSLIIFDDFITSVKDLPKITDYFVRSRHKGVSVFFLSQSFYDVPKMIRTNCNYFFFFGGINSRALDQLHRDVNISLDKEDFKRAYRAATKKKYNFFMIDTVTNEGPMKYRQNFDGLLTI